MLIHLESIQTVQYPGNKSGKHLRHTVQKLDKSKDQVCVFQRLCLHSGLTDVLQGPVRLLTQYKLTNVLAVVLYEEQ